MPTQSKHAGAARQAKTRKVTRRVPVTIKWLKRFGIQRGDKATVVMTGDVQVAELGYFSIWHYGQAYKQFRFVAEQDDECRARTPSTYTPGGICLRETKGCMGSHEGLAYGRVCAVERQGRPVETTLNLRPYDEREGPATTRLDVDAEAPQGVNGAEQPAAPAVKKAERSTVKIGANDHTHEHLGLLPGDELHVVECGDLRAGEIVVLWDAKCRTWAGIGTFVEYADGEEWGPRCPQILTREGQHIYNPETCGLYRVTKITRHITVERPTGRDGQAAITRQEIQNLRDRLAAIDADDITNCSARLALETQIYNLEHPPDLDDWSAWEGGEEPDAA